MQNPIRILPRCSNFYVAATEATTIKGDFLDNHGRTIIGFSYDLPFTGVTEDDSVALEDIYIDACEASGDVDLWNSARQAPVEDAYSIFFNSGIGNIIRVRPGVSRGLKCNDDSPLLDSYQILGNFGS